MKQELVTKKQWLGMGERAQGYVYYMQADLPGSELKNEPIPYEAGTQQYKAFQEGQQRAMLEVQDMEE